MSAEKDNKTISRRTVLRGVGASSTGFFGVSTAITNTTSSSGVKARTEEKYADLESVRSALAAQASDLLRELENRGLVPSARLDSLDIGPYISNTRKRARGDDPPSGTRVSSISTDRGTVTAVIFIVLEMDSHRTRIVLQPQIGKQYAIIEPSNPGEDTYLIDPTQEKIRLTSKTPSSSRCSLASCSDYIQCTDNVCAKDCGGITCDDEVWHKAREYDCYVCDGGCCCCYLADEYCSLDCKCSGCCSEC